MVGAQESRQHARNLTRAITRQRIIRPGYLVSITLEKAIVDEKHWNLCFHQVSTDGQNDRLTSFSMSVRGQTNIKETVFDFFFRFVYDETFNGFSEIPLPPKSTDNQITEFLNLYYAKQYFSSLLYLMCNIRQTLKSAPSFRLFNVLTMLL